MSSKNLKFIDGKNSIKSKNRFIKIRKILLKNMSLFKTHSFVSRGDLTFDVSFIRTTGQS